MKKKRNTTQIQLPDGDTITIRKVSQQTLGLLTSGALLQNQELMQVARKHTALAAEQLQHVTGIPSRPTPDPFQNLEESVLIRATHEMKRGAIRYGLVEPKFSALLEAYSGDENLPDFGLGDDFEFIANAVVAFSEGGEAAVREVAEAFPVQHGEPAGFDGGAVRPAPE